MSFQIDKHPTDPKQIQITFSGTETFEWVTKMIVKAFNVWDNAPAEAKEFADMLLLGQVQQDYRAMDQSMAKIEPTVPVFHPDLPWDKLPICQACGQRGVGHMATCPAISKK